jgi:hypothetical protein
MQIRIRDLFNPGSWIRDGKIGSGINIPVPHTTAQNYPNFYSFTVYSSNLQNKVRWFSISSGKNPDPGSGIIITDLIFENLVSVFRVKNT